MHFSEIIELQFGNERHPMLCIFKLFTQIFAKMRGYAQFFFQISTTLANICTKIPLN